MKEDYSADEMEQILHHLNYRWSMESLSLCLGKGPFFEGGRVYEGYRDFLDLRTLSRIENVTGGERQRRLKFAWIDHYLQRTLMPYENEMRVWMRGAAAHVKGRKIYFKDIIQWCQKESSFEERQILQKETGPLCKFLKPFAVAYWEVLLDTLRKDLGYDDYLAFCTAKKGFDYAALYQSLKELLDRTDRLYKQAMNRWSRQALGKDLKQLTRFDAIYLLGLGPLDGLLPERDLKELTGFFRLWDMDLDALPGLHLEIGRDEKRGSQALCFILQVPEDVYIVMNPEGGWIDLETLWHELGHGLSAVFTSPELPLFEREMAPSSSLSECYAFLMQEMALSRPFLEGILGLDGKTAEDIASCRALKEFSVFRRYAAKFIWEYDMFREGRVTDGEAYAAIMGKYTGFAYQAEAHLFDVMPEFYSLDYVLAMTAAPLLEEHLEAGLGPRWPLKGESGEILKSWWRSGNRYDIFTFLKMNGMGALDFGAFERRWREILSRNDDDDGRSC